MPARLRFPILSLCCLLAGLLIACDPAAVDAQTEADVRQPVEFVGEYQWSQGGDGELVADFQPAGANEWKIKFRFQWSGRQHTWKGQATGDLSDGSEIRGTAENGGRNWQFEGQIVDGVMTAKHFESVDGGSSATGTFKIQRQ